MQRRTHVWMMNWDGHPGKVVMLVLMTLVVVHERR